MLRLRTEEESVLVVLQQNVVPAPEPFPTSTCSLSRIYLNIDFEAGILQTRTRSRSSPHTQIVTVSQINHIIGIEKQLQTRPAGTHHRFTN